MTPFLSDPDFTLYVGDVRDVLRELPAASVDCVVTSPPYWGLRDYGEEGQIGLEATPQEYVATMVEVFREVRRVLAPHGTTWLNLGDSYASSPPGNVRGVGETSGLHGAATSEKYRETLMAGHAKNRNTVVGGLKAKDLVGIPWKVVQALQAPYYTGRIPREMDRVWLAATLDAEGTICGFDHTRADDGSHRSGVHVTITNTSERLLDEASRIWPTSRSVHQRPYAGHLGTKPSWRWIVHGIENKLAALRDLYPYLVVKREQAVVAYSLLLLMKDAKRLGHSSQKDAVLAKRRVLTGLLSDLNHGRPVDLPNWLTEPPSLYEPGWYLRSDIIWSKPNPMPESVTDRPTKAHEYVFLLSKGPRYYFDQEAVREPAEWNRWGDQTNKKHEGSGSAAGWISTKTREELNANRRSYPAGQTGGNTLDGHTKGGSGGMPVNPAGRNVRSVWSIATQPYADAHFATFPEELPRRAILAGCPEWVCRTCGKPRERLTERTDSGKRQKMGDGWDTGAGGHGTIHRDGRQKGEAGIPVMVPVTVGWTDCGHNDYRPGVVLDPFIGSGTVAYVARKHGRHTVGVELNPEYAALIGKRTQQQSLLS